MSFVIHTDEYDSYVQIIGDFRSGTQFEEFARVFKRAVINGKTDHIDLKRVNFMDSDSMGFIKFMVENFNLKVTWNTDSYVYERYNDYLEAKVTVFNIAAMQKEVHELARTKGWHDSPREDGTMIALMHSELSEALEEVNVLRDQIDDLKGQDIDNSDVFWDRLNDHKELRELAGEEPWYLFSFNHKHHTRHFFKHIYPKFLPEIKKLARLYGKKDQHQTSDGRGVPGDAQKVSRRRGKRQELPNVLVS